VTTTIPTAIRNLCQQSGPFATVYLDATRSSEAGGKEVELRWRALRETLSAKGADERTLAALDDEIGTDRAVTGPHGQVLAAADGETQFAASLPKPPLRASARWSPLPHVMPYLAQREPPVAHVIVVADRAGAQIATVSGAEPDSGVRGDVTSVEADRTYPIRKTSSADWSERHFQNRVEETWAENARQVADQVRVIAAQMNAELVLVAGDVRARTLLRNDLPDVLPQRMTVVELPEAGELTPHDSSAADALDRAVHDAVLRFQWRIRHETLERLEQALGRGDYGLSGTAAVLEALRRAQVETLVISDDPSSTATAWIGPEPLQLGLTADELTAVGVSQPQQERLDAALVRALAGGDAGLLVAPGGHRLVEDGLAALLRYPVDASERRG
jgi:Bacterial archaeo-eukaryotic release factor family 2